MINSLFVDFISIEKKILDAICDFFFSCLEDESSKDSESNGYFSKI